MLSNLSKRPFSSLETPNSPMRNQLQAQELHTMQSSMENNARRPMIGPHQPFAIHEKPFQPREQPWLYPPKDNRNQEPTVFQSTFFLPKSAADLATNQNFQNALIQQQWMALNIMRQLQQNGLNGGRLPLNPQPFMMAQAPHTTFPFPQHQPFLASGSGQVPKLEAMGPQPTLCHKPSHMQALPIPGNFQNVPQLPHVASQPIKSHGHSTPETQSSSISPDNDQPTEKQSRQDLLNSYREILDVVSFRSPSDRSTSSNPKKTHKEVCPSFIRLLNKGFELLIKEFALEDIRELREYVRFSKFTLKTIQGNPQVGYYYSKCPIKNCPASWTLKRFRLVSSPFVVHNHN